MYICQFKKQKKNVYQTQETHEFSLSHRDRRRKWKQWSPPDPERIKCCENVDRSTAWESIANPAAFFPASKISLKMNCERVCPIFDSHKNHHNKDVTWFSIPFSKRFWEGWGGEGKEVRPSLDVSNGNCSPPAILNLKTSVLLSTQENWDNLPSLAKQYSNRPSPPSSCLPYFLHHVSPISFLPETDKKGTFLPGGHACAFQLSHAPSPGSASVPFSHRCLPPLHRYYSSFPSASKNSNPPFCGKEEFMKTILNIPLHQTLETIRRKSKSII